MPEGHARLSKEEYLSGPWGGWKYMWIESEEYGLALHEAYKTKGKISWSYVPVDPIAGEEVLQHLTRMLKGGIIYTEEELYEYNE